MKIIRMSQEEITVGMVQDPDCPPEILTEVLKKGDDVVSQYAALNPNCPPNVLKDILRKGKDDIISRHVVLNPNCPQEERWLWQSTVRFGALGFLNYVDAPPEIKNNPKITQLVKNELIRLISDKVKFNLVLDTTKERKQTLDLIHEFNDKDFIISLYKRKFRI
jgi:hypothetical protein